MEVWVSVAVGAFVFLLFPIFVRINVFADAADRKLYFSLYLLRIFKLYGGYMTFGKEGLTFHLTDKKAVLLPYREMVDTRKKFEITKGFLVLKYGQVAEIGISENAALGVLVVSAVNIITGVWAGYLAANKNCGACTGDIILHEDRNCLKFSLSATVMFNFAILLLAGAKILLRKIAEAVYEKRKKGKRTD